MTAQIVFRSIFHEVPVIAIENARETIGKNSCDRRRTLTNLRSLFPGVDFSLIHDDDDVLFTAERETDEHRRQRAGKLLNFLCILSQRFPRIAIAAHGGILRGLCEFVIGPRTGYAKPHKFEPNSPPLDASFDLDVDILATAEASEDNLQNATALARRGSMSQFEIDNCELIPFFVTKRTLVKVE